MLYYRFKTDLQVSNAVRSNTLIADNSRDELNLGRMVKRRRPRDGADTTRAMPRNNASSSMCMVLALAAQTR